MRKLFTYFLLLVLLVSGFSGSLFVQTPKKALAYDIHDYLASDAGFTNINALDVNGIQAFLVNKNSFLKDYSHNGRTAAQIIHGAAHGHGDATGTISGIVINSTTGTISPIAIMATLQKEQSLITRTENPGDYTLNKAAGYACPDSGGCNPDYAGFTKQVEWSAWQLRFNYERAQGRGFSNFQVGQTITIDGHAVQLVNRTTASLYRYTPHLGGNQNFKTLFEQWGGEGVYDAQYQTQGPRTGIGVPGVALLPGQTFTAWVNYKNTGTSTWTKNWSNPS